MNDGSSPEGAGPEHCCGDLGTRQSPMPCEMPVWVGTVPNGCSPLQDTLRVLGERLQAMGAGWNLNQGHEERGGWSVENKVHIFPLFLHINITHG